MDFRARIIHEYYDAPVGDHLGREKTFAAVSRDFFCLLLNVQAGAELDSHKQNLPTSEAIFIVATTPATINDCS